MVVTSQADIGQGVDAWDAHHALNCWF